MEIEEKVSELGQMVQREGQSQRWGNNNTNNGLVWKERENLLVDTKREILLGHVPPPQAFLSQMCLVILWFNYFHEEKLKTSYITFGKSKTISFCFKSKDCFH